MINISDFLEKFKKFDNNKTSQKEKIVKEIENVVGIKIEDKFFEVRDSVLYIKNSAALRQEVFMKKQQLLALFSGIGIVDIR